MVDSMKDEFSTKGLLPTGKKDDWIGFWFSSFLYLQTPFKSSPAKYEYSSLKSKPLTINSLKRGKNAKVRKSHWTSKFPSNVTHTCTFLY